MVGLGLPVWSRSSESSQPLGNESLFLLSGKMALLGPPIISDYVRDGLVWQHWQLKPLDLGIIFTKHFTLHDNLFKLVSGLIEIVCDQFSSQEVLNLFGFGFWFEVFGYGVCLATADSSI